MARYQLETSAKFTTDRTCLAARRQNESKQIPLYGKLNARCELSKTHRCSLVQPPVLAKALLLSDSMMARVTHRHPTRIRSTTIPTPRLATLSTVSGEIGEVLVGKGVRAGWELVAIHKLLTPARFEGGVVHTSHIGIYFRRGALSNI